MSEEEKNTADLTEEKVAKAKDKVKDPKKVAAGKRLAELNRKGREAMAKQKEKEKGEEGGDGEGWAADKSSIAVGALVGAGVIATGLFVMYQRRGEPPPPPQPPTSSMNPPEVRRIGMA